MSTTIRHRLILPTLMIFFVAMAMGQAQIQGKAEASKPLNVLLLTLDDMSYGSTGVEGCPVPGVTPNIDKLASEGALFTHGYIMVPMCGPSRAALLTGRYPHCSGMMGHGNQPPANWQAPGAKTASLSSHMHQHGYRTGAILKYKRSAYLNTWDVTYKEEPYGVGPKDRSTKDFYERTLSFIKEAKEMNKPFFLYANPVDPHHPWPDTQQEKDLLAEYNPSGPYPEPEKKYTADDIQVPELLPDLPGLRKNLAPYYESLHRGDECIGSILKALEDSGESERTLVIFLSDNGMGVPGAKNTLYPYGTRTPVIFKWPGKIKAGKVDENSIVCAIDLMPTILEACNLPAVKGIEGRSIHQVIVGEKESTDRQYALTTFDYWGDSTEKQFYPQRSIINKDFCYIWNGYVKISGGKKVVPMPWNDVVLNGNENEEKLSDRIAYYMQRPVEEFYDLSKDPGCWNNLADDSGYVEDLNRFRALLKKEMEDSKDPQLDNFSVSR